MPAEDRISALLETLSGELSEKKLDSLSREFNSLAQDRRQTLAFFVLQHVCQRLASALEGEAVSLERFHELTAGIADQIADIFAISSREMPVSPSSNLWSLRFFEI
jgi:hypothetical protein